MRIGFPIIRYLFDQSLTRLRSTGRGSLRGAFHGHEISGHDLHRGRFLPRDVPGQLAGLHNEATPVRFS